MGIFVANGCNGMYQGPKALGFQNANRNVPFSIRYICVSKKQEGRNLTFVPRAEGLWFAGALRRLRVSKKHEGRNLTFVPWKVGEALPTTIPITTFIRDMGTEDSFADPAVLSA